MQDNFKDLSKRMHKGAMYDLEIQELLLYLKTVFYEENHVSMFKLRECKKPDVQDILINRLCSRYFVRPKYKQESVAYIEMKKFVRGLQA